MQKCNPSSSQPHFPHVQFVVEGIVGRVVSHLPDHLVRPIAVVEIHTPRPSEKEVKVWYILFEDPQHLRDLHTGIWVRVRGRVDQAVLPDSARQTRVLLKRYARPIETFFWGETCEKLSG